MTAVWLDDLAIGNDVIDNQKQELFRKVNNLLAACRERQGRGEIGNFLQFLKTYVTAHFLDEESFQLDRCYPFFREHREEHDAFIHKLMLLDEQFAREGATACVIVAIGRLALDWVQDHILRADRMMAEFFNSIPVGGMERVG